MLQTSILNHILILDRIFHGLSILIDLLLIQLTPTAQALKYLIAITDTPLMSCTLNNRLILALLNHLFLNGYFLWSLDKVKICQSCNTSPIWINGSLLLQRLLFFYLITIQYLLIMRKLSRVKRCLIICGSGTMS